MALFQIIDGKVVKNQPSPPSGAKRKLRTKSLPRFTHDQDSVFRSRPQPSFPTAPAEVFFGRPNSRPAGHLRFRGSDFVQPATQRFLQDRRHSHQFIFRPGGNSVAAQLRQISNDSISTGSSFKIPNISPSGHRYAATQLHEVPSDTNSRKPVAEKTNDGLAVGATVENNPNCQQSSTEKVAVRSSRRARKSFNIAKRGHVAVKPIQEIRDPRKGPPLLQISTEALLQWNPARNQITAIENTRKRHSSGTVHYLPTLKTGRSKNEILGNGKRAEKIESDGGETGTASHRSPQPSFSSPISDQPNTHRQPNKTGNNPISLKKTRQELAEPLSKSEEPDKEVGANEKNFDMPRLTKEVHQLDEAFLGDHSSLNISVVRSEIQSNSMPTEAPVITPEALEPTSSEQGRRQLASNNAVSLNLEVMEQSNNNMRRKPPHMKKTHPKVRAEKVNVAPVNYPVISDNAELKVITASKTFRVNPNQLRVIPNGQNNRAKTNSIFNRRPRSFAPKLAHHLPIKHETLERKVFEPKPPKGTWYEQRKFLLERKKKAHSFRLSKTLKSEIVGLDGIKKRKKYIKKRKGGIECKLCNKNYTDLGAHRSHVIYQHLRKNLFRCPFCDWGTPHHSHRARAHIRNAHPDKLEAAVIDDTSKYSERLTYLTKCCREGIVPEENTDSESSAADPFFCQECRKNVGPDRRGHCLAHFDERLFECPACTIRSGNVALRAVKTHIKISHPQELRLIPIDNRGKYAEALEALYQKCFPIAVPKLIGNTYKQSLMSGKSKESNLYPTFTKRSNPAECCLCNYVGKSKEVKHHPQRHMDAIIFICPLCPPKEAEKNNGVKSFIQDHISQTHPKEAMTEPKRVELELHEKMFSLKKNCFPMITWQKGRKVIAFTCNFCEVQLSGRKSLKTHVAAVHLMREMIFCPYCTHSMTFKPGPMKVHIRKKHPDKEVRFIDKRPEFRDEINWWLQRALGQSDDSNTREIQQKIEAKTSNLFSSSTREELKAPGKSRHCRRCFSLVSRNSFYSHVIERHLGIRLISCPICPVANTSSIFQIRKHIRHAHSWAEHRLKPLNARFKHESLIRDLAIDCFSRRQATRLQKKRLDLALHKARNDLKCGLCNKNYETEGGLQYHIVCFHTNRLLVHCPLCPFKVRYSHQQMRKHIITNHPESETAKPIDLRFKFRDELEQVIKYCRAGVEPNPKESERRSRETASAQKNEIPKRTDSWIPISTRTICSLCQKELARSQLKEHIDEIHFERSNSDVKAKTLKLQPFRNAEPQEGQKNSHYDLVSLITLNLKSKLNRLLGTKRPGVTFDFPKIEYSTSGNSGSQNFESKVSEESLDCYEMDIVWNVESETKFQRLLEVCL